MATRGLPIPPLGAAVPQRGSAFLRWFGRTLLGFLGWRVVGEVPNLPKFVIAVAPHTSNWDFFIGMAAMFALDLRLAFLGKHTIFRGPFAPVLRWMGGIPVDRTAPHGVVGDAIEAFRRVDRRLLAIAPEGTRRKGAPFRSGFLHIARGAQVPVMLAALDYEARCVRLGPTFTPAEDVEAERKRLEEYFSRVKGKRPR